MRPPRYLPRFIRRAWGISAVRYLVVGGVAFLFDIGLLYVLYEILGVTLVLATPLAFFVSFALTYVMQRLITFGAATGWASSAVKYTLLVVFNAFATTAIVAGADALGWPWALGKVAAVGSTTVWNYYGYRYWIFRSPGNPASSRRVG